MPSTAAGSQPTLRGSSSACERDVTSGRFFGTWHVLTSKPNIADCLCERVADPQGGRCGRGVVVERGEVMEPRRADVAIVGAALGGLVAAAILTRRGKRVVVFDAADA